MNLVVLKQIRELSMERHSLKFSLILKNRGEMAILNQDSTLSTYYLGWYGNCTENCSDQVISNITGSSEISKSTNLTETISFNELDGLVTILPVLNVVKCI